MHTSSSLLLIAIIASSIILLCSGQQTKCPPQGCPNDTSCCYNLPIPECLHYCGNYEPESDLSMDAPIQVNINRTQVESPIVNGCSPWPCGSGTGVCCPIPVYPGYYCKLEGGCNEVGVTFEESIIMGRKKANHEESKLIKKKLKKHHH